jgi:hypothetical protein
VDARERLVGVGRQQAADQECWERAESVLRSDALRAALGLLGVGVTPDLAVALMAAAQVLAEGSPEFGGDYRDAAGDLAALGFTLFEG